MTDLEPLLAGVSHDRNSLAEKPLSTMPNACFATALATKEARLAPNSPPLPANTAAATCSNP